MDWKQELLKVLISQILPAVVLGVVGVIGVLFSGLGDWIKGRAAAQKEGSIQAAGLNLLARATEIMRSVVAHVQVELADPIRKASEDGVITKAEAEELKARAIVLFKQSLGVEGLKALQGVLGDGVDTWISGLLERVLIDHKAAETTAALPEATPASP